MMVKRRWDDITTYKLFQPKKQYSVIFDAKHDVNTLYINNRFAVIVFTDPYYIALHSAAHYYFDPSAHENKHRSPISLGDTISLHPFLYILSCFKADFLDQAGNTTRSLPSMTL